MKSHPTKYAGTNFRSRLEARWAAFFDLAKWSWEYEPVDDEGWVPDFILTRSGIPVEVKPIEWPAVDKFDVDRVFNITRTREDLEKVRKSNRLDILVLGAYPIVVNGAKFPSLGVSRVTFIDGGAREQMAVVTEGESDPGSTPGYPYVVDLRRNDDFHIWMGSGEAMFRNEKNPASHAHVHALWREAGNRVQWRGKGAKPTLFDESEDR
jgi:hypothetical protein